MQALQLLIKAHIGQISEKAAILLQLEELLLSKRVLADINAVQLYDETLELILPKPGDIWARVIGSLRLQLVKALSKDVDAGRACFQACVAKADYEHARHIANSLEKNFPGTHEYVFWNIATMFLYSVSSSIALTVYSTDACPACINHLGFNRRVRLSTLLTVFKQSHSYPEKERKLYGALAEGMIRKLADATIKAGVSRNSTTLSSLIDDDIEFELSSNPIYS